MPLQRRPPPRSNGPILPDVIAEKPRADDDETDPDTAAEDEHPADRDQDGANGVADGPDQGRRVDRDERPRQQQQYDQDDETDAEGVILLDLREQQPPARPASLASALRPAGGVDRGGTQQTGEARRQR